MIKFKVGQTVRIKQNTEETKRYWNRIGKVSSYVQSNKPYPYTVEFKGQRPCDTRVFRFKAVEMEAVSPHDIQETLMRKYLTVSSGG